MIHWLVIGLASEWFEKWVWRERWDGCGGGVVRVRGKQGVWALIEDRLMVLDMPFLTKWCYGGFLFTLLAIG